MTLSPPLALRIGVAGRALADITMERWVEVVIAAVGLPITEEKLRRVTMARLRSAQRGLLNRIPATQLYRALSYLNGTEAIEVVADPIPTAEPYFEGDLSHSVRVAVASNGGEQLDGLFTTCRHFLIFQVAAEAVRLVAVRPNPSGGHRRHRTQARLALLADCALVFVTSIGALEAAALARSDIHALKQPEPVTARTALTVLQQVLQRNPPPWLAKAAGLPATDRLASYTQ